MPSTAKKPKRKTFTTPQVKDTVILKKELYPATIPGKEGTVYTRLDDITFDQLMDKVTNGAKYPIRLLMREDRADKIVTEMIVVYVGTWVNCIDINSTTEEQKESILRFRESEFLEREVMGMSFAIYEKVLVEKKPAKK